MRHKHARPDRRRPVFLGLVVAAIACYFLNAIFLAHGIDRRSRFSGFKSDSNHPIAALIADANRQWQQYEDRYQSATFAEAAALYRETHGRHPPPGYKEWYEYARKHNAQNVDDFHQVVNDLRPFWAIPPKKIREMAASLPDSEGMAVIRVRNHEAVPQSNEWRASTFAESVNRLAKYLPDMNIAMNTMDQPRVLVGYDQIQEYLEVEKSTRALPVNARDGFTPNMDHFDANIIEGEPPGWMDLAGRQYMKFAKDSCPPGSPARRSGLNKTVDRLYKSSPGGFISNFSASSDICVVGPSLENHHGFLFSPAANVITKRLFPIFSECKTSVNNDILFPANMYYYKDARYAYHPKHDYNWAQKANKLLWRGVTSGGRQLAKSWNRLHRQRFVQMTNATEMSQDNVTVLHKNNAGRYTAAADFGPSKFAASYFDVGFTEAWGCFPECSFYDNVFTFKKTTDFGEQFKSKFLVDIDGHSFSGRWRAFLQSRSLGIKATIFREWHDSRLFAWKHFVPMDNQFTDLYALMTYFIGLSPSESATSSSGAGFFIPSHDLEAEAIATQGRDWAQQALRDEDMDIYLYLLLLEYARIIDDNRDHIGYSGSGREVNL